MTRPPANLTGTAVSGQNVRVIVTGALPYATPSALGLVAVLLVVIK